MDPVIVKLIPTFRLAPYNYFLGEGQTQKIEESSIIQEAEPMFSLVHSSLSMPIETLDSLLHVREHCAEPRGVSRYSMNSCHTVPSCVISREIAQKILHHFSEKQQEKKSSCFVSWQFSTSRAHSFTNPKVRQEIFGLSEIWCRRYPLSTSTET